MNQPAVFISCVSPEFRQTRSRVAAILTRLGYTPVIQEIFGTEPGDLRTAAIRWFCFSRILSEAAEPRRCHPERSLPTPYTSLV